MTLLVREVVSSVEQTIRPKRNALIQAIRPHLYIQNAPNGTVKIELLRGNKIVAESPEVEIQDLANVFQEDFIHGLYRFDVSAFIKEGVEYTVRLVTGGGYTFDENAYIGWVNDYDLQVYDREWEPPNDLRSALKMEIWESKLKLT